MLAVTKIEQNAWAGGKDSCAVCIDFQAVGALEFFGELAAIFEGVWAGSREREGSEGLMLEALVLY